MPERTVVYVISSGRGGEQWPQAVTDDPGEVFDLALRVDAFHRLCYGGEPEDLRLSATVLPEPGESMAFTRAVRITAKVAGAYDH